MNPKHQFTSLFIIIQKLQFNLNVNTHSGEKTGKRDASISLALSLVQTWSWCSGTNVTFGFKIEKNIRFLPTRLQSKNFPDRWGDETCSSISLPCFLWGDGAFYLVQQQISRHNLRWRGWIRPPLAWKWGKSGKKRQNKVSKIPSSSKYLTHSYKNRLSCKPGFIKYTLYRWKLWIIPKRAGGSDTAAPTLVHPSGQIKKNNLSFQRKTVCFTILHFEETFSFGFIFI